MKEFDAIVIGSGGGLNLASAALEQGYKVAVIEKGKMGGTCLNRGCIPSKMLIHPANLVSLIKTSNRFAIDSRINSIDFSSVVKRINAATDKDSNQIKRWYQQKHPRLTFYGGHAAFVSDKVIEVNNQRITGKKIYIAAGASPFTPPIPGLDRTPYWTSAEALRARRKPNRLLVIGGGYIACELGYAFSALGSEVRWFVRDSRLLSREDQTVSKVFTEVFSMREKAHFQVNVAKVEYKTDLFILHLDFSNGKKQIITGDALLVATGISPNTAELRLEQTGIKTDKQGFIKTNRFLETTVKEVYALGDVAGNYFFRHAVNFEADFLIRAHFIERRKRLINYPPMPHAVFTNPEIGSVGATEQELIKKKIPYAIGFNLYEQSAMGQARQSKQEFVKLLFHKKTRKLLGAHILGEEAATMIHQLIYALTFGATVDDLVRMIYIHPALPEVVRNAAFNALDKF
ncbi:dihydrolipoyl dehydrogenase [Candidatus Woesearchaeota archaeon]|nr:dihydrolipoyl dehydrogenase [Candidatus Woesearchaeota archaeon]